jgi:hypothetical protein
MSYMYGGPGVGAEFDEKTTAGAVLGLNRNWKGENAVRAGLTPFFSHSRSEILSRGSHYQLSVLDSA